MEAKCLLAQIDLQFTGLLVNFCKVLGDVKSLSDMLQSSSLDLDMTVDLQTHCKATEGKLILVSYGTKWKNW